jgi:hypothetical protein
MVNDLQVKYFNAICKVTDVCLTMLNKAKNRPIAATELV